MTTWDGSDQLDERLQIMLALKAALYTKGIEEKLIERAIRAYAEEIPLRHECCFECNTETNEILSDYHIPGGRHVIIEDVPTMICPKCGNQEWDINVLAALDQIAEGLPDHSKTKLLDLLN